MLCFLLKLSPLLCRDKYVRLLEGSIHMLLAFSHHTTEVELCDTIHCILGYNDFNFFRNSCSY